MDRDKFIDGRFRKTKIDPQRDSSPSTALLIPTPKEAMLGYLRSLADEHGWLRLNANRAANRLRLHVDEVQRLCRYLIEDGVLRPSTMERDRYQVS
jgi:hypothetical protein